MTDIIIEEAQPEDAKELVNYLTKVVGETLFLRMYPDEVKISIKEEESFLKGMQEQKNSFFLVARKNNHIIAAASLQGQQLRKFKHTADLGISVLKEYWGQGIGKKMMIILIQWSKANPILRKINLHVNVENQIAVDLYQKMGFKIEGRISNDFFYQNRFVDTFLMGIDV